MCEVEITEQPMQRGTRFRYESEPRCRAVIFGENSTFKTPTYPTIEVKNYTGSLCLVVSCVTHNFPHRPHPCQLLGENTKNGYYFNFFAADEKIISLYQVEIQCPKKSSIGDSLKLRKLDKVDPFGTGFNSDNIDMSCVRLCFQVFIEGSKKGSYNVPLEPVVSQPIYDRRQEGFLNICLISHYSVSTHGNNPIIILCEKVRAEDIEVRFFEPESGWEKLLKPMLIHKNVALMVITPEFDINNLNHDSEVQIQLKRPSDQKTSNALSLKLTKEWKSNPNMKRRANCLESTDSMYARQYGWEESTGADGIKSESLEWQDSCASTSKSVMLNNKKSTRNRMDLLKNSSNKTVLAHMGQQKKETISAFDVINSWESELLPEETVKLPPPLIPKKLMSPSHVKPYVVVREQPMKNGTRFRYESELRYCTSVIGEYSYEGCKSYPSIDIVNNAHEGYLIVSCVTDTKPYLTHPNKLIGKMTDKGIFRCNIRPGQTQVIFKDDYAFGIQCIKKNRMQESLSEREAQQIDPFSGGFKHKNHTEKIDVTCLRLCFQVFIFVNGKKISLKPVVSNPLFDKKVNTKPTIVRISHYATPASGGTNMILLCDKIKEDDINVRFYDGNGWEKIIESPRHHKQMALIFESPEYPKEIEKSVQVYFQLERPSDGEKSDSRPFYITPSKIGKNLMKKPKPTNSMLSSMSFTREHQSTMLQSVRTKKGTTTAIEALSSFIKSINSKGVHKTAVNNQNIVESVPKKDIDDNNCAQAQSSNLIDIRDSFEHRSNYPVHQNPPTAAAKQLNNLTMMQHEASNNNNNSTSSKFLSMQLQLAVTEIKKMAESRSYNNGYAIPPVQNVSTFNQTNHAPAIPQKPHGLSEIKEADDFIDSILQHLKKDDNREIKAKNEVNPSKNFEYSPNVVNNNSNQWNLEPAAYPSLPEMQTTAQQINNVVPPSQNMFYPEQSAYMFNPTTMANNENENTFDF